MTNISIQIGGGSGHASARNNAERGGFEPPEACASTVFKTVALVRSATSPPSMVLGWDESFVTDCQIHVTNEFAPA